jgi:hypothetical protein
LGRRKQKGLLEHAAENPAAALYLAVLGFLLWGPLPEMFIRTIFGGEKPVDPSSPDAMGNIMSNGFMGGFMVIMPWFEVLGVAMITAALAFLMIHANRGHIKHPRVKKEHLTAGFTILFLAFCYFTLQAWNMVINPAGSRQRMDDMRSTMTPDARSPARTKDQLPDAFPESGTEAWGPQGKPIAGSMSTISIWDVAGSDQNKVIRVRRHTPTYGRGANRTEAVVTLFLKAGERHDLKVRPGLYDIVAASSEGWDSTGFTGSTSIVSFGTVNAAVPSVPTVVAMGAPDQEATLVDGSWF